MQCNSENEETIALQVIKLEGGRILLCITTFGGVVRSVVLAATASTTATTAAAASFGSLQLCRQCLLLQHEGPQQSTHKLTHCCEVLIVVHAHIRRRIAKVAQMLTLLPLSASPSPPIPSLWPSQRPHAVPEELPVPFASPFPG